MLEKCPECRASGEYAHEKVEMIDEPLEGRVLTYSSKYTVCGKCRVTWYSKEQMRQQMQNRGRNF